MITAQGRLVRAQYQKSCGGSVRGPSDVSEIRGCHAISANDASAMRDPVITESPARIICPGGAALTSIGNIDQDHIV
jgi:hypothetical protein